LRREFNESYVVITVGPGKARDIAQKVSGLPGVKMSNACWGSPDIFAVVEVADQKDLNNLVLDKIQSIEGVGRAETHIAID
jgi:DNA-binding Lrp family transcriptional regulator